MLVLVAAANTDEVSLACHSVLRAGPGLRGVGKGWQLETPALRGQDGGSSAQQGPISPSHCRQLSIRPGSFC